MFGSTLDGRKIPGTEWSLIILNGVLAERRIPLEDGLVIGRGTEASVQLPDSKLSRCHARVRRKRSKYVIEDLRSNNGTFVNGKQIRKATLRPGDLVSLGRLDFEVIVSAASAAADVDSSSAANKFVSPIELVDTVPGKLTSMPTQDLLAALDSLPTPPLTPPPEGYQSGEAGLLEAWNLHLVFNLATALQSARATADVLSSTADAIFKAIDAERCYIILIDPDTNELIPHLARHRDGETGPVELSKSIIDRVVRDKSAIVSTDASGDPRFDEQKSVIDFGIRSVLCVPILTGSDVVGVIQLDRLTRGGPFLKSDFELATVIASLLGTRLDNVRLFEEQTQTIKALREAQDELIRKERMALLGQLTTGLAYEISDLMSPFAMAKIVAMDHPDDEDLVEVSNMMVEAHRRITTLLHEIRMMARGEQPELRLDLNDLGKTVEAVVMFAQTDNAVKQHEIEIEHTSIEPFLYDEGALKQVLLNLIRNAAEVLPERSTIRICVSIEGSDEDADSSFARVAVIDEGPGIPSNEVERIFEPFYSMASKPGVGLGLHVSRSIVERHGGEISCQSDVGRGTAMSIVLPMRRL